MRRQLDEVKNIAGDNIGKFVEKGEKLADIDERASIISADTRTFVRASCTVARKERCRCTKVRLGSYPPGSLTVVLSSSPP